MPKIILVVDDEPDLSHVIVERLKNAGYDVSSAPNGRIALEQIKTMKPDLIITDVLMPELDGFGLFKALQQNAATAKIPVIVLTARGKMSDTFTSMGVADFLAKPFDAQTLLATVNKHLATSAPVTSGPTIAKPLTKSKKIFIAGVEDRVIQEISKHLQEQDYTVETTADCLQILPKIGAFLPNVFLLEIPLENIAVKDIVNIVRGLPKLEKIPIFLYSYQETVEGGTDDTRQKAISIDTAKQECIDAGATAYVGSYNDGNFVRSLSKLL